MGDQLKTRLVNAGNKTRLEIQLLNDYKKSKIHSDLKGVKINHHLVLRVE